MTCEWAILFFVSDKRVFVVPTFESKQKLSPVLTKQELLDLWDSGSVQPFYYQACWKCQQNLDFDAWKRYFYSCVEALPVGGVSHVARLNFKTSCVGVYKCLLLIVGFAVTVAIWPREVVSCRNFILRAVATFWAMLLVRIYPGRASVFTWLYAWNFLPFSPALPKQLC